MILAIEPTITFWGIIQSAAELALLFLGLRFLFRGTFLNQLWGSWWSLQGKYLYQYKIPPYLLKTTSARIGLQRYVDTIKIYGDEHGIYLQQSFFLLSKKIIFIPFNCFTFKRSVPASWLGKGFSIFTVDKVDVWLQAPYDALIITKLPPIL
ncbi:MAG: hypothetical protein EOO56_02250 [Hymenobacter sp.]|nr:MAG: hypothetical protein EOO56_02250 [Hymenobacter sp.]